MAQPPAYARAWPSGTANKTAFAKKWTAQGKCTDQQPLLPYAHFKTVYRNGDSIVPQSPLYATLVLMDRRRVDEQKRAGAVAAVLVVLMSCGYRIPARPANVAGDAVPLYGSMTVWWHHCVVSDESG